MLVNNRVIVIENRQKNFQLQLQLQLFTFKNFQLQLQLQLQQNRVINYNFVNYNYNFSKPAVYLLLHPPVFLKLVIFMTKQKSSKANFRGHLIMLKMLQKAIYLDFPD